MLSKLGATKPLKPLLAEGQMELQLWRPKSQKMLWDFARNLDEEHLPDRVANCLRFALYAKSKKFDYLPHFRSLTMRGSELCLKVTNYPMPLRRLLYDRESLEHQGT